MLPTISFATRKILAVLVLAPIAAPLPTAIGENLARVYDGKLDHEEGVGAVDWSTGPDDVWKLSSFEYDLKGKFHLEFDAATVVFGKHGTAEEGYSVVWAAVFPETPGEIRTSESGHGDRAKAIFMRFHPDLVGKLFPTSTVEGPGDPNWLVWAKRQYGHKINACWQWDNMPVVGWLDMDPEGTPIDAVGIEPAKVIPATMPGQFKEGDPVFGEAMRFLEKRKGRKSGKRD